MENKVRLDKYLWAIRIFKTRTLATAAIDEGKVKWNGANIKPSKPVGMGDRYDIKTPARKWNIEVTGIIQNRVAFEEAITKYVDLTSEEDKMPVKVLESGFYTGKRISKTGRPTKKQRRGLADFMDDSADEA